LSASPLKKPPLGVVRFSSPRPAAAVGQVLAVDVFHGMISLERKRSERTQRPFVLLLMDCGHRFPASHGEMLRELLTALQAGTRETDVVGWYEANAVVGVMFTEIASEGHLVLSTILSRVSQAVRQRLTEEQFGQIKFSFHVFPQEWDPSRPEGPKNPVLYPDLQKQEERTRIGRAAKRVVDLVASLILVSLLSPILFLIAAAIKATSRGPVLFRQERIGAHGRPFTFLKFRSMHVNNDASRHKEYVQQLIAGAAATHPANGNGNGIYKLTNDPRVTAIGRLLRRTSLDELPQLINVLRGDMSLVGPRPALPYEVEAYAPWHRRRLFEAKPGITGLWQVQGRSRVGFDEMVRLDLRYARTCSLWLDLKILWQTPRAVVAGDGAC
jgi:lipopolysaccharide/colanic/teichoic acid biosynthesis glycosyltransferase